MSILTWVVVGTVAGWLISVIQKRDFRRDWLRYVLLGMSGSAIGGLLYGALRRPFGSSILVEVLVAVGGAFIFLWILEQFQGSRR